MSTASAPKVKPLDHPAGAPQCPRVCSDCLSVCLSLHQTPQFVDIDLEEEEDSSDEEYCPEEQEDDTAEEVSPPSVVLCCVVSPPHLPLSLQTLPSDGDSLSSPPRMHRGSQAQCVEGRQEEALEVLSPAAVVSYLITGWTMPNCNTPDRTSSRHQGVLLMWFTGVLTSDICV